MFAEPLEHRVFFAVQPDEVTAARLRRFVEGLACDERLRGRPIDRRCLHVTLRMVGRWMGAPPEEAIDLAKKVGDQIAMRSFRSGFKRLQSWRRSNGPLVLVGDDEVIGLERLHDTLAEAGGLKPDPHFVPHVSLIWSPDFLAERAIRPFTWMVREFVLIHSVYGQSRHEVLGRWPLTSPGA